MAYLTELPLLLAGLEFIFKYGLSSKNGVSVDKNPADTIYC